MQRFRSGGLRNMENHVTVTIPHDEDGYLGRECPNPDCERYFKITPGTGIKEPAPCHCPYCGHEGDPNTFFTKEQIEYATSIAKRKVVDAVRKDLKALEFDHKPKGPFGIGISMRVKPGAPVPIRSYQEKDLETEIECDQCTLRYAIYGVFGWCPDCGTHNSLQILNKNLELARKKLALVASVEGELSETLIGDALAGVVSAFDGFGRQVCSNAQTKPSFQNLDGGRKRVQQEFNFDVADCLVGDQWLTACRAFQKRHVISHKMGVVDEEYISKTSDPKAIVGRKVPLEAEEIAAVVGIVEKLGKRLYEGVIGPLQTTSPGTPTESSVSPQHDAPLEGLEAIDSLVLETACQTEIATGMSTAIRDSFHSLIEQGVSAEQIIESQEILQTRGFVKLHYTLGHHPQSTEVTARGFDLYAKAKIPGFRGIVVDVARLIVEGQHTHNRSLAEALNQPIRIITHVMAHFESKGWLETGEAYGGGYQHIDVLWVSPELKRWLEKL